MAQNVQISCINKSDRLNPHERILSIGGINPDKTHWSMSVATAIQKIKDGIYTFYVNQGGRSVGVIIARSASGHEYLKTVADGEQPNNLLSLPECPK
jgi:hypothetical protein